MDSLRFLFFLYSFPPVQGTAAKRNYRIAAAVRRLGAEADVFTATKSDHYPGQADLNIEKMPVLDYRAFLRKRTVDGAMPENRKSSALTQWVIRLVNTFPINIILGEGGLIYFFNLLIKGHKRIRQKDITHLYTSYRPFADHYAAYWLKKRHPQVFWIADFRDLIIDPHYHHIFFSKAHKRFFRRMFSQADILTTVSQGLTQKLKSYNARVIPIRNSISDNYQIPKPKVSPYFTITYTGSMFLDKRNAEPLFTAIQELFQEIKWEAEDIRIVYAGKDGHLWRQLARTFRFESIFEDMGILSDEETIMLQRKSCVNVLLTISSDELQGVLTGKMIEYFEAGVPVIGIVMNQNDPELQSLMHKVEIGDSFSDAYEDVDGIKEFLFREYSLWKESGRNRIAVNSETLQKEFSPEAVMQPFIERISMN